MSNTTVKELHCKMCYEKFSGNNRIIPALFHLKNKHPGIFQRQYKRNQSKDGVDICSPEVSSSLPSPDPPTPEANSTQANSGAAVKETGDVSTPSSNQKTPHPVPGQMKIYFSLNDTSSAKPYRCNRCGRSLTNLKMCVVHLLKDHKIPLKQNRGTSPSTSEGVSTSTKSILQSKKKQTARKSIGSCGRTSSSSSSQTGRSKNKSTNCLRSKKTISRSKVPRKRVTVRRKVSSLSLKIKTERNRIMKIKLALMKQHLSHPLLELPHDLQAGACSPEDCFESLSGSQENDQEDTVEEEAALLERCDPVDKAADKAFSGTPGEQKVEPSSENSSTPQRSNDKFDSSRDQTKHGSLWNSIYWNSTQFLECNKANSSGGSVKKANTSTEGVTSPSDRTSPVISIAEPSIPQCGTAMLKQLRTNSANLYDSAGRNKSLSSVPRQRSKSLFNAVSPDEIPACAKVKKSARKTTRPVKARGELLHNNQSTSAISYIHSDENKQGFSKTNSSLSSVASQDFSESQDSQDVSKTTSSSSSSTPSPYHSSSISSELFSSQPNSSDVSLSQSPLSSTSQLLSHFFPPDLPGRRLVASPVPKKATGRKSFRNKPPS